MRKAIFAALFLAVCASVSFAQSNDYKKGEFFAGYSANEVDTQGTFSTSGRDHFNGFNVEGTYNLTRYIGAQADFSYHQKSQRADFSITTSTFTARLSQFMGGVKVQDNATDARFRPFAHALIGVAHLKGEVNTTGFGTTSSSDNGLAIAVGGGLDFRITKK